MTGVDVRIRVILLTLLLVVAIAAVVEFWPERTTPAVETSSMGPAGQDDQIRRHFDWAVTQLRTGHYEQAINGFRAVLAQSPGMPEAHLNIGFAEIELERYRQAQRAFQTAIDLDGENPAALFGLGDLLLDGGNRDAAETRFLEAIDVDAAYLPALVRVTQLFVTSGRYDQLVPRLDAAITTPAGLRLEGTKTWPCRMPPSFSCNSTPSREWSVAIPGSACSVSAKPPRPRRHSRSPRRDSRLAMWELMVERDTSRSASAAEKPPHSTTLLNTRSRRRSASATWPMGPEGFIGYVEISRC